MTATDAPRHALDAALKPLLPVTWRIVPYQRNLDTLDTTTVMFKQNAMRHLPAAPLGAIQVDMTVTIITDLTDPEASEDALDADVLALVVAFDDLGILWTEARKVGWNEQHIAYDIDIQLEATKEEEETP